MVKFTGRTTTLKRVGKNKYKMTRPLSYPRKKRTTKLPKQLKPKVYAFKRDIETTISIISTAPEGWQAHDNMIGVNLGWALSSLDATSVTQFQAMFNQYKINAARVKLYFSNTNSDATSAAFSNSQMIVRYSQNQDGIDETLTKEYWQRKQAKKYKMALNGGKPITIYMPLRLVNEVAASSGQGRSMMKPIYLPSNDSGVVFYGVNLSIGRADGQPFTSGHGNNQFVRMITTLYFTCRGLQ